MVLVYVTMLPYLSTTEKCVVVSPGPVTGSATASASPGSMPAFVRRGSPGDRVGIDARAGHDQRAAQRRCKPVASRPLPAPARNRCRPSTSRDRQRPAASRRPSRWRS